jgi:hypothetical protein
MDGREKQMAFCKDMDVKEAMDVERRVVVSDLPINSRHFSSENCYENADS